VLPEKNDNLTGSAGETITLEITVRNPDGSLMPLTGAISKMGIYINDGLIIKDCSITGSVVKATLTSEETSYLNGNYKYVVGLRTFLSEVRKLAEGYFMIDADDFLQDIFDMPISPIPIYTIGRMFNPVVTTE